VKYEIWTMDSCPACIITKEIFQKHNIEFTEKKVFKDFSIPELEQATGKRALPSIFIDGEYVGSSEWVNENFKD
jgi:glutaredoxin